MKVTIYSDGSFSPQTNFGSWAFSLKSPVYNFAKHGKIPSTRVYSSIHYCEMFALCKAVLTAMKVPGVKEIIAKTDSHTVIKFFYGYPPKCKDDLMSLSQGLIKTIKKTDIKVIICHVKAHNGNEDNDSYMNNSVDKLAKKVLKYDQRI